MSKADEQLGKLIVLVIVIWLFLWIFLEIAKAGVKGKDVIINRCGNCNMILKPYQTPCPNCGYTVMWK